MIRNRFLQQLESNLVSQSKFKSEDFTIQYQPDSYDKAKAILRVQYNFDPSYFIEAKITSVRFDGSLCPGGVLLREDFSYTTQGDFLSCVTYWANRIREELAAIPFHREIAEQRSRLEEIEEYVSGMPEGYFAKDEGIAVANKLLDLEAQLKEQIEKYIKDKDAATAKISELESDFQILRQSVEGLTKRNWIKSFLVRVARWSNAPENRELLKSGYDLAKNLLGDGNKPPHQ